MSKTEDEKPKKTRKGNKRTGLLIGAREASAILAMPYQRVLELMRTNTLKSVVIGSELRTTREEVVKFIDRIMNADKPINAWITPPNPGVYLRGGNFSGAERKKEFLQRKANMAAKMNAAQTEPITHQLFEEH